VLYVASDSTATSGTIGELRVRYRVKFTVPILSPNSVVGGVVHFNSLTGTSANNLAGMTLQPGGTPAMTGITAAGNTITFPANIPGNYLGLIAVQAATSAGAIAYNTSTGGVSLLSLFSTGPSEDGVGAIASNGGTTTAPAMFAFTVKVTAAGGTIVLTPGTIVTSGTTAGDVFVVSLPSTVLTEDEVEQLEINELKARADEQDRKIAALMRLVSQPSSPIESYTDVGGGSSSSSSSSVVVGKSGKLELDPLVDLEKSVHLPRSLFKKLVGAP